MPRVREIRPKRTAQTLGHRQRFPPKVKQVCWVWWDRQAMTYRGTVRTVPTDEQEQWDKYRIWKEAAVITDVAAVTIPELVDMMRRYADVDADTQRDLLLDTPPSFRNHVGRAGSE